ncbi:MAG: flagellar basal body P-ring protein FlgI [Candidatus Muiribacteriota bacterium]
MKKYIIMFLIWTLSLLCISAQMSVSLKDIARFGADNRENQLTGYGIVGGLDGTGDNNMLALQSTINFLNNFGVNTNADDFNTNNIAAVIVTATIPPFARNGDKIDITVSSIGDSQNLEGGVLFQTPLIGADKEIYAVAAGPISIGGFNVGGAGAAGGQNNHPTVARIPEGAIIENEVPGSFSNDDKIEIILKDKNFSMAEKVKKAVDEKYGRNCARAIDSGTVVVDIPYSFREHPVTFISNLKKIEVVPVSKARVIINEKTGSVVISKDVKISPIAVAHGDISIAIGEDAEGNIVESGGASLNEVVEMLNTMGAEPRDLIAIFQLLKQAGALHADLQII